MTNHSQSDHKSIQLQNYLLFTQYLQSVGFKSSDTLLTLLDQLGNLEEISMRKEIKLWSTMAALYFLCVVAMAVWQNKLISHIFLAKFVASFLASLVKLLSHFTPNEQILITFKFIRKILIATEQLITLILFFELYLAICKMEKRKYRLTLFLKKIGMLSIVGIVYASLFTGVEHYHHKIMSTYIWIDDICLSAFVAIPLIFYFIKVMLTLIKNGKFRKDTLLKNHFPIHLMITLFLIQISKLIIFSINFHLQQYELENRKECTGNLKKDHDHFPCILEQANLFWESVFSQIAL